MPELDVSNWNNSVSFHVNGKQHTVINPHPRLLLVDYLRSPNVGLTGTKIGCYEGGCAACTVVEQRKIERPDGTSETVQRAINSCLRPVASLDGLVITTTEGLGNACDPLSKLILLSRHISNSDLF